MVVKQQLQRKQPFLTPKKKEHIEFLKSLVTIIWTNKTVLFVHAGLMNMNGVAYEYYPRFFSWDRTLWETALIRRKS
jgi:serine/threonine protein phosphatase 1